MRKISFQCIMQMGLGTGSPHIPAPYPLSFASLDSSDSLSHAFSWLYGVARGVADVLVFPTWLCYSLPQQ